MQATYKPQYPLHAAKDLRIRIWPGDKHGQRLHESRLVQQRKEPARQVGRPRPQWRGCVGGWAIVRFMGPRDGAGAREWVGAEALWMEEVGVKLCQSIEKGLQIGLIWIGKWSCDLQWVGYNANEKSRRLMNQFMQLRRIHTHGIGELD